MTNRLHLPLALAALGLVSMAACEQIIGLEAGELRSGGGAPVAGGGPGGAAGATSSAGGGGGAGGLGGSVGGSGASGGDGPGGAGGQGGAALPELVAAEMVGQEATELAAGGGYVFWTSEGGYFVKKALASGGGSVSVASNQQQPVGIGTDSSMVFWAVEGDVVGEGVVRAAGVAASPDAVVDFGTQQTRPFALTVGSGVVVWADIELSGGVLLAKSASEAPGGTGTVITSPVGTVRHLAVADTFAYWITSDGGSIRRTKTNSITEQLVVDGIAVDNFNAGLAAVASTVFWTSPVAGTVSAAAADGTPASPAWTVSIQTQPQGIAVAGSDVIWANHGAGTTDGSIMRCAWAACTTPVELATGLDRPSRVAVGDGNVYWIASGGAEIWKLAL